MGGEGARSFGGPQHGLASSDGPGLVVAEALLARWFDRSGDISALLVYGVCPDAHGQRVSPADGFVSGWSACSSTRRRAGSAPLHVALFGQLVDGVSGWNVLTGIACRVRCAR